MKALPIILILSTTLSFVACSSNSIGPEESVPRRNEDVVLYFVDENGNDLLDPEHENSLDENNLDIYYLRDGEKSKVFNSNYDRPKNFHISHVEDQDKYVMRLLLSSHIDEGHSTTFIEFPDGSMDTLKLKGEKNEYGTVMGEKFWYNGKLVWDRDSSEFPGPGPLEITKSFK